LERPVDTPQTQTNTNKTKKTFWVDYDSAQKMMFVMTIFTVIYSVTTIFLFVLSYENVNYVSKDQRPWVKVVSRTGIPEKGPRLAIEMSVIATGKNPAKSVSAKFFVERVKTGETPKLSETDPMGAFSTGIMFPDSPPQRMPLAYDLLGSEMDDFNEGRIFLAIYGRVNYRDMFQTEHWTKFCSFSSPKDGLYSAEKCTAYNDTDDN
jgi:hypothetical protein